MIRKKLSKLPDSAAMGRTMNYALKKSALVGGSEVKFEGTSIKDYVKLGVKKCDQVNNKHDGKTGRKQEVQGLHEMISFDVSDKITPEKAAELALGVWREVLNIDKHRHRWAVHTDTDKIHVHLIWNKRDNSGKVYEQLHDYALFEKACHKTEIENGLKVVENRKFLKPGMPTNPKPSNEYRFEKKGEKSEKTLFKEAVTAATDKAMTAGEFLEFLHADGYTLILNGNTGYSLEKDGQIFKASDVGASYKLLKARFGDDPQFSDTLARLGVKTAPVRDFGSIGGDFHDQQSAITESRIKKSNRVLDTRFDTDDGRLYRFKDSNRTAFSYSNGTARFNSISPMVIKAGLQKLTESGKPDTLHIKGDEAFKRVVWLQFQMMGLDKKGYSLKGYEPTKTDHASLEKMKLENPAFKKPDQAKVDKKIKPEELVRNEKKPQKMDIENFTQFKVEDTRKAPDTPKEARKAQTRNSGMAGILAGAVEKMSDMKQSFSAGAMEEKLSEMRVLDAEIKDSKNQAEEVHYQNERRKLQQPRPN